MRCVQINVTNDGYDFPEEDQSKVLAIYGVFVYDEKLVVKGKTDHYFCILAYTTMKLVQGLSDEEKERLCDRYLACEENYQDLPVALVDASPSVEIYDCDVHWKLSQYAREELPF